MNKWFTPCLALLAPIAFWACSPVAESTTTTAAPSPGRSQATNLPRLYAETCAKCHGDRAQGGGGGTPSLITKEKFDQKYDRPFFDAIKNGKMEMGMEAYGETLSDEEIWGLVVVIRELQSQGLRSKFGSPRPIDGVYKSQRHSFRLETVVEEGQGLETPWAIDWLPDGRALITNRPGALFLEKAGKLSEVTGVPRSLELGQGGLMDVAVHPDYNKNGWVYLGYTEPADTKSRAGMTKIVRGKIANGKWTSQQTIFEADQKFYTGAGIHFGTRIVFDGKGHIFFVVGERGGNMLAQSLDNPFGKIYRVNEDGSIPSDNPFASNKTASHIPAIWTLGHRNPQGLVMGLDGNLWDTEHGPRGGDEVNLITKGANYGWPVVAFSINYNGAPFRTPWPTSDQKFTQPIFRWLPSIGACGLDVVDGPAFPQWKGDLIAGGLSGANVDRIRTQNGKLVEREELLQGIGRVRDVQVGPEGYVYVVLNQPDKVIRLVPAK